MTKDMNIQTLLKGSKFQEADRTIASRIVALVTAREKNGKTHLGLEAPGPIAVFDSDYGLEGVVGKFPDKRILTYRVPMPDPEAKDAMNSCYDTFKEIDSEYDKVLANPSIRSVVFDTATELWEMTRLAYLGRLEKVKARDYGPANGAFRRFLKKGLDSNKNIVLIQKMKQEYMDDKFTGNYVPAGFGDAVHIVQVIMRPFYVHKDMELPDGQEVEKGQFGIHVTSSRHNPSLNDSYWVGELANFSFIASMVVGKPQEDFQ